MKNKIINIAVDAMGGDNAPYEIIKGVIHFIKDFDVKVTLVGKEDLIQTQLLQFNYDMKKIEIIHAEEIVSNDDSPTDAIKKKKDSSMVVGLNLLKEEKVDAFISAGNTGALVAGGTLIAGRIKGVQRPALAPIFPTLKGVSLVLDCGANVDAKPIYLKQFAEMGSIYVRDVIGIENPTVGLINIGTEEGKGNALVKEAYKILKNTDVNFVGNVESRDIFKGDVDVLVCDAFVGNIILKQAEGILKDFFGLMKRELRRNIFTKIGALMAKGAFKNIKKTFDYSEYGGVPLLGLKKLVIKAHGNSKANEIEAALRQSVTYIEQGIAKKIEEEIKKK